MKKAPKRQNQEPYLTAEDFADDFQVLAACASIPGEEIRRCKTFLKKFEKIFKTGVQEVLWDAIVLCERWGIEHPSWVKTAQIEYAKSQGLPSRPNKGGRPRDHALDFRVYFAVQHHQASSNLSQGKIYDQVYKEFPEFSTTTVEAVRKSYYRGKKFYTSTAEHLGDIAKRCYKLDVANHRFVEDYLRVRPKPPSS